MPRGAYEGNKGKKLLRRHKENLKLGWLKRKEKGLGIAWNKGKKHSKEHREKLKEAWIKRKERGDEPWNKGLKGIHLSLASEFKKGRKALSGKNHPCWNSNREEIRKNLRNDGEYLQWVKKVKKRDNNTCKLKDENCFGYNIVHHIENWSKYPELRYKTKNGITLCQAHHPRKRAKEKELEDLFKNLIQVSKV